MRALILSLLTGTDLTPLLVGLPNDLCPCPHWGYLLKRRIQVTYADGGEVLQAGDLFYLPPGHTAYTAYTAYIEEDADIIEFSRTHEHELVLDVVTRNAEVGAAKGKSLPRRRTKFTEQEVVYRAEAATGNACLVKARCAASDCGRIVHRSFYDEYLEQVRSFHAIEACKKAIRKRQVWVATQRVPGFTEAKEWHGLRRLRLRGLENANIQGLLIATGQNLKRLLAASGWGRRHAPCGSLVIVPGELQWLVAAFH